MDAGKPDGEIGDSRSDKPDGDISDRSELNANPSGDDQQKEPNRPENKPGEPNQSDDQSNKQNQPNQLEQPNDGNDKDDLSCNSIDEDVEHLAVPTPPMTLKGRWNTPRSPKLSTQKSPGIIRKPGRHMSSSSLDDQKSPR